MPELILKQFKGVNLNEINWQNGYSKYTAGFDIYGLGRNVSKISYPGVLQSILPLSAGTQAASPSAVTEVIHGFARVGTTDYAAGAGNPIRLYYRNGSTWQWLSGTSGANAASPACNIEAYSGNLYYAQTGFLGKYDGTNFSPQFQTLSDTSVNSRPMKVFAGMLFIGDGKYIASYDGTTFKGTALTIPTDFQVRCMEIFGDLMYITIDNGSAGSAGTYSRMIAWDGTSPTYNSIFDILDENVAPSIRVAGGKLFLISNRASTFGTTIYQYIGGIIVKLMTLPIKRSSVDNMAVNGTGEYSGGLVILSNEDAIASYEDGVAGAWLVNQHSQEYEFSASLAVSARSLVNMTLGAMEKNMRFIGASDNTNSTFEIFELQGDGSPNFCVWESLPIDAASTNYKTWGDIKVNFEAPLTSGEQLNIKYKRDDDTNWTTIKSITSTDSGTFSASKMFYHIGVTSRVLLIRIEFIRANANDRGTRIHSLSITYEPSEL